MTTEDGWSLVEPCEELREDWVRYEEELVAAGHGWPRDKLDRLRNDFAGYLREIRAHAARRDVPAGLVPGTVLLLVRDGRIYGTVRLRYELNAEQEHEGGHIGYDVRPSERRKGVATRALALALERARGLGLARVLLTCDKANSASARVIQKNGGRLASEGVSKRSGKAMQRYWVELESAKP